jgi:hypothetical protein
MLDFALKEPGHGMEADVRMRADRHSAGGRWIYRAESIEKAPGTNRPASMSGQSPMYGQASDLGWFRIG